MRDPVGTTLLLLRSGTISVQHIESTRSRDRNGQTTFEMTKGEQLRDYLPIELLAHYVVRILERPQSRGVVNICSGNPISVRRLVEEHLAKTHGPSIQLAFGRIPYPEYEPIAFWGDTRRLKQWCGDE